MTLTEEVREKLDTLREIGDSVQFKNGKMKQISVIVCRFNKDSDLIINLKSKDGVPTATVIGKRK